jgi:DNA helicase-2/ATP-dependent DNA helicase PcrA
MAITFTNKAAGEMAAWRRLTGARSRGMWLPTFHSACVRILRREAGRFGYPSSFTIYDAADSERLMALVCRELDLDPKYHPPKAMAGRVSTLKNELLDYETVAARASGYREKALAEAYGEYQRRLVAAGAMDFDDLIMVTVNLLQAFGDMAAEYRRRFRHVLVDEYQDTNRRAVRADQGAGRGRRGESAGRRRLPAAGRAVRGRRRRPVDLRVPRRDDTQHHRVRARLPGRQGDPARAELPLHPEHPGGRQRRRRPQFRPDAEEPVVGRG